MGNFNFNTKHSETYASYPYIYKNKRNADLGRPRFFRKNQSCEHFDLFESNPIKFDVPNSNLITKIADYIENHPSTTMFMCLSLFFGFDILLVVRVVARTPIKEAKHWFLFWLRYILDCWAGAHDTHQRTQTLVFYFGFVFLLVVGEVRRTPIIEPNHCFLLLPLYIFDFMADAHDTHPTTQPLVFYFIVLCCILFFGCVLSLTYQQSL